MNESDGFDTLLDSMELEDFEERFPFLRRPAVPTPPRQPSFAPKPSVSPASQTQVLTTARNLDNKIETLSNGQKALETRTTALEAGQARLATEIRKEAVARKRADDTLRAEVQQGRMLSLLMPMLTQKTVDVTSGDGPGQKTYKVVTASDNQMATMLPLLLLMQPSAGGETAKGPFGDSMTSLLLVLLMSDRSGR